MADPGPQTPASRVRDVAGGPRSSSQSCVDFVRVLLIGGVAQLDRRAAVGANG